MAYDESALASDYAGLGLSEASNKLPTRYQVTKTKDRDGRTYTQEGTLDELVKDYSYTLETGAGYSHEKGNAKINQQPKTIASLISNLNNSVNNAAANGYAGISFAAKIIPEKTVDEAMEATGSSNQGNDSALMKYQSKKERMMYESPNGDSKSIEIDCNVSAKEMIQIFNSVLGNFGIRANTKLSNGSRVFYFMKNGDNIGEIISNSSSEIANQLVSILDIIGIVATIEESPAGVFVTITSDDTFAESNSIVQQNQSKDFIDDIIAKDDNDQPHDLSYLDRMRKLAGLREDQWSQEDPQNNT
jgi:hypothetical protein